MFTKVMLIGLTIIINLQVLAADCPFNKPYSRADKCLCKGVKEVDANNMLVCKGQATVAESQSTCSSDVAFDKDLKCVCATNLKKYSLRETRNVCLSKGQKVFNCAVNIDLKNSDICHCPKKSILKSSGKETFKCEFGSSNSDQDNSELQAPPTEKATSTKSSEPKKKTALKKAKKK